MKLTEQDKEYLRKHFHEDERSIRQIEEATSYTRYELDDERGSCKPQRIGAKRVIELLGRKLWLSGMRRSAFHWEALVHVPGMDGVDVYFDSSRYFKEE